MLQQDRHLPGYEGGIVTKILKETVHKNSKNIIIEVQGGAIIDIHNIPLGTFIEVHDFDITEALEEDQDEEYIKSIWGNSDEL